MTSDLIDWLSQVEQRLFTESIRLSSLGEQPELTMTDDACTALFYETNRAARAVAELRRHLADLSSSGVLPASALTMKAEQ